jgi:hypothetical protein
MLSDAQKIALGPARFLCVDCGKDTNSSEEYYMLIDALWHEIAPGVDGMLCLECSEHRLGRLLVGSDFKSTPVNASQAKRCPALALRLARNA